MDINATLLGKMITFAIFIWFTLKFVWPPLMKSLQERQKRIADGLAAADKSQQDLEIAQQTVKKQLQEAKIEASHFIEQANQRANHMVEEAKEKAHVEGERLISLAKEEINQEMRTAKQQLTKEVSHLVVAVAERVLSQKIDAKIDEHLINELIGEI